MTDDLKQPAPDDLLERLDTFPNFYSMDGARWYKGTGHDDTCKRAAARIRELEALTKPSASTIRCPRCGTKQEVTFHYELNVEEKRLKAALEAERKAREEAEQKLAQITVVAMFNKDEAERQHQRAETAEARLATIKEECAKPALRAIEDLQEIDTDLEDLSDSEPVREIRERLRAIIADLERAAA